MKLWVRDVFDLEIVLGLTLFGIEDEQASQGPTTLEDQVNPLVPHSGLRNVGETRGRRWSKEGEVGHRGAMRRCTARRTTGPADRQTGRRSALRVHSGWRIPRNLA